LIAHAASGWQSRRKRFEALFTIERMVEQHAQCTASFSTDLCVVSAALSPLETL
jgi:hypothetical protein